MKYEVWVNFSGCACYKVESDSIEDALQKAIDISDPIDCEEWDYNAELA